MIRIVRKLIWSLLFFISILGLWIFFFGPEQYFVFDPYIDTEWNDQFSPAKFEIIESEMDTVEIFQRIGTPLYQEKDFNDSTSINLYYSMDGKLSKTMVPWYMSQDYAWCNFSIKINAEGKVESKSNGWCYD
ncbi:MAG: hypothetical protein ABJG68_08605 [Crocinitomicaceae bacterium]